MILPTYFSFHSYSKMYLDLFKTIAISLLLLLTIISTTLIGFCLYTICKSKRNLLRRPSIAFILNVLLVHLYQSIVVIPLYAGKKYKFCDPYTAGKVCDVFRFTYMISYYCSVLSVLLIAIDRFIATHFILKYRHLVTRSRVLTVILLMWIYVIILCSIPFFKGDKEADFKLNSTTNHLICTYTPTKEWSSFMLIANCILPYVALLILYKFISNVVLKLKLRQKERGESFKLVNNPLDEQGNKENHSITTLSVILAFAYFILWSPSVFYHIVRSFCPVKCFHKDFNSSTLEGYLGFLTKYIAFLDTIAAPIIYCFSHDETWSYYRKIRKKSRNASIDLLLDSDRFCNARETVL